MTTDFRALCAELVQDLAVYVECDIQPSHLPLEVEESFSLLRRARAALAESEPSKERPNRLRVGDMWEFWTEIHVKGKKKPVEKLLQWEVIGWHNGQYAWELLSLDGEHREYLMEFAPSYEDMRFLGSKING